ncbi:MAG: Hpt domain-containing protein, partial [Butyrivibrio sp.]|nr:Hpt domain-containing protein [Butyrivibrio sp.]
MDVSQYLSVFLDEAKEHLQSLNDNIMVLEGDPENEDCINEIFRSAHSMKGMAGTMGYTRMQNLTHDMEDVFSDVRAGKIKIKSEMIDILLQCLDAIQGYVDNITENQDEGTEEHQNIIKALADIRSGNLGGDSAPADAPAADAAAPAAAPADSEVGADGASDYRAIRLEPSVKSTLEEAKNQGKKIYGVTVHIQESCILKAARGFLVFKGLEEIGEIAVSEPSTQDIEDEKFEFTFSLILITDESKEKVEEIVKSVSEVEGCDCGEFDPSAAKGPEDKDEAAAAPAADVSPAAPAPAAAPKQTPAPAAGG